VVLEEPNGAVEEPNALEVVELPNGLVEL